MDRRRPIRIAHLDHSVLRYLKRYPVYLCMWSVKRGRKMIPSEKQNFY